jgi:hypothetical protein
MGAPRNQKTLLRLLSGKNRLSAAEKEDILAGVLARVEEPGPIQRRRVLLFSLGGAAAALAVVLIVVIRPRSDSVHRDEGAPGVFASRGGEPAASFEARCAGADGVRTCRAGDKLLFEVAGGSGAEYFSAFARRGDGAVIWYFPAEGESSPALAERAPRGVLDSGFLLGPEHPPGRYTVVGLFSPRPLSRDQVRETVAAPADDVIAVSRELVIE